MRVSRDAIVDAGARVLARDRAASLAAVAAEASVSRATLHRVFPNRDTLIEAIVERAWQEARRIFDEVDVEHAAVPEALVGLVERLMPVAHLWVLVLHEPLVDQVPHLAEEAHRIEERLVELMRRGQRDHFLRADQSPRWMTYFLGTAITAAHEGVMSGFLAPREAAALVLSAVLDGIRRPVDP